MNNKKNIDDYFDDNFEVTYTGDLPSIPVGQDDYDDRYEDTDYLNDYETDDYYDETDRLAPDYDDDYDAPTGNTRNLGKSAKKSKKGKKSDDYDVDFIDL